LSHLLTLTEAHFSLKACTVFPLVTPPPPDTNKLGPRLPSAASGRDLFTYLFTCIMCCKNRYCDIPHRGVLFALMPLIFVNFTSLFGSAFKACSNELPCYEQCTILTCTVWLIKRWNSPARRRYFLLSVGARHGGGGLLIRRNVSKVGNYLRNCLNFHQFIMSFSKT